MILSAVGLVYSYSVYKRGQISGQFVTQTSKRVDAKDLHLKQLPQFEAKELFSGENINSCNFKKGIEYIVHFFASWCAPCLEELPKLLIYAKKNSKKRFYLIATKDNRKDLLRLFKGKIIPSNVTVLLDSSMSIMEMFGTSRIPESYFFDQSRKLLFKAKGTWEW